MMRIIQIVFGLAMILFGALLFLAANQMLTLSIADVAGIALILSGMLFWIPGIALRRSAPGLTSLFIPGSMAFAIGAILVYISRTETRAWTFLWPILLIALGFSFLAMYYLGGRARGLRVVGLIVGGIGIFFLAIFLSIFVTGTPARIVGPILLVALGLLFVLRALIHRPAKNIRSSETNQ